MAVAAAASAGVRGRDGGKAIYFYGHARDRPYGQFSQFYAAPFEHEGRRYVWAEQWMMANKAMLMGDEKQLDLIMAAKAPRDCKALGRRVSPWDQAKWDEHKYDVVLQGTRLKVQQNPAIKRVLMDTANSTLAEASPSDCIWGIGVSVKDAMAGRNWRGQNLLGKALMEVRDELKADSAK
ncbi:N-glycosidase Npun_R5314-like [Sycon ciliatum]|uniref:N-glycosidase Npun_R5314-like n=1 Tax=Sycon ciliatum TaxID=27933 RepID=UPI0020AA9B04|eukprot:scpid83913/ scgid24683/ Uncharacterized protein R617